jgi:putative hydrolase of the HAD superfamily
VNVEPATIEVVVFDLDGVVRHWDPDVNAAIEDRHGLERGAILDTAFDAELGPAAVTGALDYDTWTARIGERLACPAAVAEWGQFRGHLDHDAVELVAAVRAAGCRVGLLSNATTRLEEDLGHLGIADRFDSIFNTARLGVAKPDHEVYRKVVDALGVPAGRVVFTDDTPSWADAATEVGLVGIPFTGVTHLRKELRRLGISC